MRRYPFFVFLLSLLFYGGYAHCQSPSTDEGGELDKVVKYKMGDPELDVLWITEKNGQYLPLEALFRDEKGDSIRLGELIDKPTLILPIYFYCPSSCSLNLVNLATAIKKSNFRPGKDFKVIAFSFNELEDDNNARIAKRNYLRLLPKNFSPEDWKFLTGSKESILEVTNSIGYKFQAQADGTFIHPSALIVAGADGMIIKYVYGSFLPGDVDIALSEAQSGIPATSIRRFLGYCFNYDPQKSRSFFQNLKFSVLIGFAVLGVLFFLYLKRVGKRNTSTEESYKTGK